MKNRFEIVKNSKFETLTHGELESVKGGWCISCMKRSKGTVIGRDKHKEISIDRLH